MFEVDVGHAGSHQDKSNQNKDKEPGRHFLANEQSESYTEKKKVVSCGVERLPNTSHLIESPCEITVQKVREEDCNHVRKHKLQLLCIFGGDNKIENGRGGAQAKETEKI